MVYFICAFSFNLNQELGHTMNKLAYASLIIFLFHQRWKNQTVAAVLWINLIDTTTHYIKQNIYPCFGHISIVTLSVNCFSYCFLLLCSVFVVALELIK